MCMWTDGRVGFVSALGRFGQGFKQIKPSRPHARGVKIPPHTLRRSLDVISMQLGFRSFVLTAFFAGQECEWISKVTPLACGGGATRHHVNATFPTISLPSGRLPSPAITGTSTPLPPELRRTSGPLRRPAGSYPPHTDSLTTRRQCMRKCHLHDLPRHLHHQSLP